MTSKSQSHLLGKFPVENILLSFGSLIAGPGTPTTKVLRVFRHMGLFRYNEVMSYCHQGYLLIRSII